MVEHRQRFNSQSNAANAAGRQGTIINDDSNNISINDVTLYEGSGGTTIFDEPHR